MRLTEIAGRYRRFGAFKAFQDLGLRTINRIVPIKILKGMRIEQAPDEFLHCAAPYRGEFLTESRLAGIIRNRPEFEMTEGFLRDAYAKGDECYGFLDGNTLASYSWYSNKPTEIDIPGMMLHFDDRYIYMYKGFTHERYRGQRLHALGMARALDVYIRRGYRGFLAYVEWNNFSSLKSCYRLGYVDFGKLYLARLFGRYVMRADRGASRYGFRLEYKGPAERAQEHFEAATSVTTDRAR
jgi:hypothetical protein